MTNKTFNIQYKVHDSTDFRFSARANAELKEKEVVAVSEVEAIMRLINRNKEEQPTHYTEVINCERITTNAETL